jgi:sulfur-oxidizing protein SoxY
MAVRALRIGFAAHRGRVAAPMKLSAFTLSLSLALAGGGLPAWAGFGDTQTERDQRWQTIRYALFEKAPIPRDDSLVSIEAPERAIDAAIVPISVRLAKPSDVSALYLVIDDNPSPLAAHFTFGPDMDPSRIELRVRINTYTQIHAVAEMKDGSRVMTTSFVKASGGCSAPMGVSDEEAMRGMGEIRVKVGADPVAGHATPVRLMIRHPNFNGMQMNDVTRDYTPARYIQKVQVDFGGDNVFFLESDISLASNPVIDFQLKPHVDKGPLVVSVDDSQGTQWHKTVDLPSVGN